MAGVTLIELMTVLSILAILGTLAAPSLRDFLVRNRTAAISNEFVASVLRARSEAVSRNSCVTLCRSTLTATPQCDTGAGVNWQSGWLAFANPTCDATIDIPAADDIFVRAGPFDAAFTFTSNATNSDKLMFSAAGIARAGDAGRFNLQYLSETRSSNRGICVSALGRTRMVELNGTC
jgi:type IV fimbrial biogenesis protein FimT